MPVIKSTLEECLAKTHSEISVVIGNRKQKIHDSIFCDHNDSTEPVYYTKASNLETLCYELGGYKSKSEARRAGRYGEIPKGYSEMWLNKKTRLYIYNYSLELDLA